MAVVLLSAAAPLSAGQQIRLTSGPDSLSIATGGASYRFTRQNAVWAFDSAWVRGVKTAVPLSRADSFFKGGGEAATYRIAADTPATKQVCFGGFANGSAREVCYAVSASDLLPRAVIELDGPEQPVIVFRTATASPGQRGAWATRGETASDAEEREAFIDGSGRLVFGHSRAGRLDAAYVIQAEVRDNINRRGKSAQITDTYFKSGRGHAGDGAFFGYWQLRIGAKEPKRFAMVLDRDLGGRLHDVCEKYFAAAVDSQVDVENVEDPYNFDPYRALELMPLRLSAPESFIPGYGWHMEEYFPGYGKAAYPYGDDAGIQTAAFLAYEGHATRREWEKNFGKYVMDHMPLWGDENGGGYFVRRPEGYTRWAYHNDYTNGFPFMEGGNWNAAEFIYWTARISGNDELKARALDLMKHDVLVKLDRGKMFFPPCWNPRTGTLQDHRDDWNITAGLAYAAEMSSEILYPETRDPKYLQIADQIAEWLRGFWGPEARMNFLHPKVNTFHCYMGWLQRAMIHRYERSRDRAFLEVAQDLSWVMMLTFGTTSHRDSNGRPLAGVTVVGVRNCVDYDCTPHLCHEKDLPFLEFLGPLLDHVSGPGYAKFLAMHKLVLARDSWKDAFRVQEQRDLNLRTNYDNFARGMTNLAFALNRGSDRHVAIYEKLVSKRALGITRQRDFVLANGTRKDRSTTVQVRFLEPGRYRVELDGKALGVKSARELERGFEVTVRENSMRHVRVTAAAGRSAPAAQPAYDESVTYLSDVTEAGAQRGIGLPVPTFQKDHSFRGNALAVGGKTYRKGLGLAANTVIVYNLGRQYKTFAATLGVDADAAGLPGPKASVNFTIFVDGENRLMSGGMTLETPARPVEIDVRNAETLVIRMSGNWDDNGNLTNDTGDLADARLIGKSAAAPGVAGGL